MQRDKRMTDRQKNAKSEIRHLNDSHKEHIKSIRFQGLNNSELRSIKEQRLFESTKDRTAWQVQSLDNSSRYQNQKMILNRKPHPVAVAVSMNLPQSQRMDTTQTQNLTSQPITPGGDQLRKADFGHHDATQIMNSSSGRGAQAEKPGNFGQLSIVDSQLMLAQQQQNQMHHNTLVE